MWGIYYMQMFYSSSLSSVRSKPISIDNQGVSSVDVAQLSIQFSAGCRLVATLYSLPILIILFFQHIVHTFSVFPSSCYKSYSLCDTALLSHNAQCTMPPPSLAPVVPQYTFQCVHLSRFVQFWTLLHASHRCIFVTFLVQLRLLNFFHVTHPCPFQHQISYFQSKLVVIIHQYLNYITCSIILTSYISYYLILAAVQLSSTLSSLFKFPYYFFPPTQKSLQTIFNCAVITLCNI